MYYVCEEEGTLYIHTGGNCPVHRANLWTLNYDPNPKHHYCSHP